MLKVYLKKERDKSVRNGHPWIFSGAIKRIEGSCRQGDQCMVIGDNDGVVGYGYYNAKSSIAVRMLSGKDEPFTDRKMKERLRISIAAREKILADKSTDSCRLVNSEGDFLPGLIIDSYAGGLVMQISTAGMDRMRSVIVSSLKDVLPSAYIYERCDMEAREREGLTIDEGLREGTLPIPLVVMENGIRFEVDLPEGQKTGFYFDQRENRAFARSFAGGLRCLDCFSYTGAFAMNFLAGGALSVTAVDCSKHAGALRSKNLRINCFDPLRLEDVCADVFSYLRSVDRTYDVVVLDPPKFARRQSDVQKAARGYKDINLAALKKIARGGIMFTFSCSNAVDARLFRQIVFAAAADAGRQAQIIRVLSAGPDHPISIAHPEGEYLKGLALRVY